MEFWVTVSGYAFDDDRLSEMLRYQPSAIRINMGRESAEWAGHAMRHLVESGFEPSKIYLDVGNRKPRLKLPNRSDNLVFLPDQLVDLVVPSVDGEQLQSEEPALSTPLAVAESDKLVVGDGPVELRVVRCRPGRISVACPIHIAVPDGTALLPKNPRVPRMSLSRAESALLGRLVETWKPSVLVSFTESAADTGRARGLYPAASSIVPKVETRAGVAQLHTLLQAGQIFMLGRGDLANSVGMGNLGPAQEHVMNVAGRVGARGIIATGFLESVARGDTPSRAEVVDLYNACRQGAMGIALTSETAGSPRNAIRVVKAARQLVDAVSWPAYKA